VPSYAILEAPSALGHVREHLWVERALELLLKAELADGVAGSRGWPSRSDWITAPSAIQGRKS
jgi:hypothetical protein